MSVFVQLAFNVDGAQCAQNGSYAPPAAPGDRTHADGPCARLSASPTAPATGAQCIGCRLAAERRCAVCAGPLDPGKKSTAQYCGRRCKDRADTARNAERDHANGACHEPRRCECDRPLLILDDDPCSSSMTTLAETRCLHCGRPR